MYAVRGYHDQPLHFINSIYFHAKTAGDRHYKTVAYILLLLVFVKFSLLILMIYLSILYIIQKVANILQKFSKIHNTEADKFLTELKKAADICIKDQRHTIRDVSESCELKYEPKIRLIEPSENKERVLSLNDIREHAPKVCLLTEDTDRQKLKQQGVNIEHYLDTTTGKEIYSIKLPDKSKWKVNLPSVIVVNILFYISLICFHIMSIVGLIHYNNEVLDNVFLWLDVACSIFFLVGFLVIFLLLVITILLYKRYRYSKDEYCNFYSVVAAELVTLNITYIVSYYLPYMFLAFSFDPLITIATYFILLLYNLSGYLVASTVIKVQHVHLKEKICSVIKKRQIELCCCKDTGCKKKIYKVILANADWKINATCDIVLRCCGAIGSLAAVLSISQLLNQLLKLGSFDDFKGAQSVLLPLAIGIVGFLLLKPTHKRT